MLEITANGKKMQLPADIQIDLTFENPMFMVDRIPATYSMSFTMPATVENLKLSGYANRINSTGNWDSIESAIIFNAVVISKGKLQLEEVDKKLKFSYVGSLLPGWLKQNMNYLNIGLYDFGSEEPIVGQHDYTAGWSLNYRNTIFNNNASIGDVFAACPVRVTQEEWVKTMGAYNMGRMYLNMFNVQNGNYLFPEFDILQQSWHTRHASCFPQPYIHYLIDTVMGPTLRTNFFKNIEELKRLCMVSITHPRYSDNNLFKYTERGAMLDYYYAFKLSSFFNKYPFNDFLRELLKVFCCSLMPRPDGTWDLLHNKEILENTGVDDWSEKVVGTPVISKQKARRYGYGYSAEGTGDANKGVAIPSIESLMTQSEGTFRITSTGEVYEKRLKDQNVPGVYIYDRVYSGLEINAAEDSDDENETFDVTSEVSPLRMRTDDFWVADGEPTKYPWYVPEFSEDRFKIDAAPQIGFVRGFYNRDTKVIDNPVEDYTNHYPLLSPFNYDPNGNKIGDYSLAWEGTDGLLNKFHKEFKEYMESDRMKLKADLRLTQLDLKNLDYKRKKYIRGKLYRLLKIETSITKNKIGVCRCEFEEA